MKIAPTARVHLPGLTGLRGVGAIWVLVFHAQYGMHLPVADAGYLGVDLFFILSGFVLSLAHPDMRWSWPGYRAFLQTRFARIFPMHWVALALVALVLVLCPAIYHAMPHRFAWPGLVSSALLVQNWGLGEPGPWNGPAWSLSTEWLASIAFPLFLLAARRVVCPRRAAVLCALCLAAFAAFLMLTRNPTANVMAPAGMVRTVCEFAAGCLLYRVYAANLRVSRVAALAGAALVLVGLLVPGLATLAIFGFPVLVLLAAQPGSLVARTLSCRTAVFLGEVSFSIYLLHWILLQASNRMQVALDVRGVMSLLWFCGFVAVVVALSAAAYRLVEVPARRRLRARVPRLPVLATEIVPLGRT
jgi:peptidoglycan/LPS O-acetylase OafA/YrhL